MRLQGTLEVHQGSCGSRILHITVCMWREQLRAPRIRVRWWLSRLILCLSMNFEVADARVKEGWVHGWGGETLAEPVLTSWRGRSPGSSARQDRVREVVRVRCAGLAVITASEDVFCCLSVHNQGLRVEGEELCKRPRAEYGVLCEAQELFEC
jgi:hypothetical protein